MNSPLHDLWCWLRGYPNWQNPEQDERLAESQRLEAKARGMLEMDQARLETLLTERDIWAREGD